MKSNFIDAYSSASTFIDVLRSRAERNPNKKAFTFIINDGNIELTYSELDKKIRKLAALLQSMGLKGERALLLYPPGFDYIIGYFACLYAGVIAVPVYPPDPSRLKKTLPRIQSITKDAGAKISLTSQSILDDIGNWKDELVEDHSLELNNLLNLKWIATDNLSENNEDDWKNPELSSDYIAYLQYTSGSTGTPKGVMINHSNLLHNTKMIYHGFNMSEDSEGVIWLPIYHDMGLIGGILEPIFSGSHCTLLSPVDFLKRPFKWLQIISDIKDVPVISGGPNFAYELCIRATNPQKAASLDLSNWDIAFSGAEPVRADTINKFTETFKVSGFNKKAFYPCYGLAEGTLIVAGSNHESEPLEIFVDKEELKNNKIHQVDKADENGLAFVSSGTQLLDGKIKIVNPETKNLCSDNEVGEIWAASKSNAQGYFNRNELSEETFKAFIKGSEDGPYLRTGDLGFMQKGELFVTGRLKDLIIISGSNHYPQDIEATAETANKLLRPGSTAAFSIELDNEEKLIVVLEARAKQNVDWEAVTTDVRKEIFEVHNIHAYDIVLIKPHTIFKTSSGKIRRRDTKKAYLNNELEIVYCSSSSTIKEGNNLEDKINLSESEKLSLNVNDLIGTITNRISKLLSIPPARIDITQPFITYGIDSAKAVGLVGELEEYVGHPLSATLLWDYPTIKKLAEYLSGEYKSERNLVRSKEKSEPIAIIGIGCKFPKADNCTEFWELLINGEDAIEEVPKERWDIDEFYDPDFNAPGKMVTRWGGFLKDVDKFDPTFFGISPREAVHMDPQQRILLEVTWQAFENAGIIPKDIVGSKTGVFVGIGNNDYSQFNYGHYENASGYSGTGNAVCISANRISFLMDFTGPSLAIDTACSSSLVAIHLAVKSLRDGESDMAVAGGINLILTPDVNIALSKAQMMAEDGRCKTFDSKADGYVRSEGAGAVILKRLSDAQRDGDNILAVIKGTATNQDGKSNGITAPNRQSQEKVIYSALNDANVTPDRISYIEAHGTGTGLGDPIETQALAEVFKSKPVNDPIILGAVKTNIGHLEAAAGMAGLIKVVLSIKNQIIPQNIHFEQINPLIPIDTMPFKIPTKNEDWKANSNKRIAGISSFGFGGTNAHVIIEDAPQSENKTLNEIERPNNILTISNKTKEGLINYAKSHLDFLTKNHSINIYDYCYTNNKNKSDFEHRLALIIHNKEELIEKLSDIVNGKSVANSFTGSTEENKELKLTFLFTGQGSQYIQMAKELYNTQPVFKNEFDRCTTILNNYLKLPLTDVVFPKEEQVDEIHNTAYTQPALFTIEYALAKLWKSWGVEPDYVIGHSVGEYTAAVIAGVFSLEDGLKLIAARGRLMQSLPQNGEMAVIFTNKNVAEVIEDYKDRVSIAGFNGPANTVISGDAKSVQDIVKHFENQKIKVHKLKVSHAFHSPLMDPILDEFEKIAQTVKYNKPLIPIVSNLTGELLDANTIPDAKYWRDHIRNAVQFLKGMETLDKLNSDIFLEVGPHPVLMGMGQNCLPNSSALWISSLHRDKNDWDTILGSLAQLYTKGYRINWKGFDFPYVRNHIFVPTYPFVKERYWVEGSAQNVSTANLSTVNYNNDTLHPLIHRRLNSPLIKDIVFETQLSSYSLSIIDDHRIYGIALLPATGYAEIAIAGAKNAFGTGDYELNDLLILEGIAFDEKAPSLIQITFTRMKDNISRLQIFSSQISQENNESDEIEWALNATGTIKRNADIKISDEKNRVDIEIIKQKCKKLSNDELSTFYESIREYGFEHGKTMRLIREMWFKEGESLGWFTLEDKSIDEVNNYLVHPALTDAGTQLLAAALAFKSDVIEKPGIYLPIGIEKYNIYKTGLSKVWGHIIVNDTDEKGKILKSTLNLYDEEGEIVAEILGLTHSFTTRETLSKLFLQDLDNWIYKIKWEKKVTEKLGSIEHEGKWLIFGDSSELSSDVIEFIKKNKGEPVLVIAGNEYKEIDHNTVQISLHNPEHIKKLLNYANTGKKNQISGIVYLWNLNYTTDGDLELTQLKQIHKNTVNQVLLLVKGIVLEGWLEPPKVWLFTQNTQPVNETSKEFNLAHAPLLGLGNVIELEHPELNLKRIDLENTNNIKEQITSELLLNDEETQIAYRNGERYVARLTNAFDKNDTDETTILNPKQPLRLEIKNKGVLDNLKLVPLKRQKPIAGTVEIRVHATGLNFRDILNALDLYPGDAGLLGGECSGVVTAVGEGVTEFKVGDEVLGIAGGSFSTHVLTYADLVVHKPKNITFEEASAIPITFLTAYYTLHKLANISKGDRVLIHAASGGVGLAAIQIAKMYGATIFGTAGNDEKRAVLHEEGVELIMDSRSLDFADEIMKYTNGEGVNILLNSFSGDFIEKGMSIMAKNGHFLEIGKIGIWDNKKVKAYREDIKYNTIAIDDISANEPGKIKTMLQELMAKFEDGSLAPIRHKVYQLKDSVSAFRFMKQALHIGKVVIAQKVDDDFMEPEQNIEINDSGTYLITGGRGALGLLVAKWLVSKGAKNLILAGRSEPSEEVKRKVHLFEKAGVRVQLPNLDISNREETKKMLEEVISTKISNNGQMPALKGIIHAAGVLNDGVLIQQDWDRFEKVMKSKIDGAWNLHLVTKDIPLDFMIYFSSAASMLGSPGQGNYAAANSFMDILAYYRRSKNLPAQSINWGPWSSAGMAASINSKKSSSGNGMNKISPFQGIQLLDQLFDNNNEIQIGVMPIEWEKFNQQFDGRKIPALLTKFLDGDSDINKKVQIVPELIKQLDNAEQSERQDIIINFLSEKVVRVLGLSENHKISITKPLSEMGLDSLMGIELKKAVDQGIGKNLPATMVFNYPTIEALSGYLLADVLGYEKVNEDSIEDTQENEDEIEAGSIKDIEELSEEEAEELLLKKLGLDKDEI